MNGFRTALGFLTVLPAGPTMSWGPDQLRWYPVVGLMIGLIWAGFDALAGQVVHPLALRAGLDTAVLVLLTGGLHLDGLGDTADGLLSHRPIQDKLRIMKDVHVGSWGVLAMILILGLKALALTAILARAGHVWALILVPAFGRTALLAGMSFLNYGRGAEGLGHGLFTDESRRSLIMALAGLIPLSLLLGWPQALAANLAFAGVAGGLIWWYRKSLGCITGDMLGAMCETVETTLLVVLAA